MHSHFTLLCTRCRCSANATALMAGRSRETSPIPNCGSNAIVARPGSTICASATARPGQRRKRNSGRSPFTSVPARFASAECWSARWARCVRRIARPTRPHRPRPPRRPPREPRGRNRSSSSGGPGDPWPKPDLCNPAHRRRSAQHLGRDRTLKLRHIPRSQSDQGRSASAAFRRPSLSGPLVARDYGRCRGTSTRSRAQGWGRLSVWQGDLRPDGRQRATCAETGRSPDRADHVRLALTPSSITCTTSEERLEPEGKYLLFSRGAECAPMLGVARISGSADVEGRGQYR